jgi:HPt (histidine-containing phosphotransfer) domain-containing protein
MHQERLEAVDFNELNKIVPDSAAQIQVLQDFHAHIREDHAKLTGMLRQNDAINVERTAHRMHGASRMVGARYLAKACAAVEQAARSGDMAGVKTAAASLHDAIGQFESFLLLQAGKGK